MDLHACGRVHACWHAQKEGGGGWVHAGFACMQGEDGPACMDGLACVGVSTDHGWTYLCGHADGPAWMGLHGWACADGLVRMGLCGWACMDGFVWMGMHGLA